MTLPELLRADQTVTDTDPLCAAVDHLVNVSVDLRRVAAWLEEHRTEWADVGLSAPKVHVYGRVVVDACALSANRFADAARIMAAGAPKGTVTKEQSEASAYVTRCFGTVALRVFTSRGNVCERKVVGQELVDVVEWVCAPVLAEAG